MKLIKQSYEILEQSSGIDACYKQIELAGRTCYKSEDKITEDSAKEFVEKMAKLGHGAMLEHGTVYLKLTNVDAINGYKYRDNPYSKYVEIRKSEKDFPKVDKYITTNYRVLIENNWLNDLDYQCEPTEHHEKRISVRFITSRGISHELVRHREFSFAQESQRYCNYSKDKFDNEITFIEPDFINDGNAFQYLSVLFEEAESYYRMLLEEGFKPQQAREVLPNATKTEIIMTGFESDWKYFFSLRTSPAAHPMMRDLVEPLKKKLF